MVRHQLRGAGYQSVWSPAWWSCWCWVVSLGGAPLSLPSFVTPEFQKFFRLGRVLRTTLPTGRGGVVHLFVVYGYQGAEEDAGQLLLTDKLLQAVFAEAQVVCIGQPLLVAGDLNADPALYPVWLRESLLVGLSTLPWLTHLGRVRDQMPLADSGRRIVLDLVGTSSCAVLMHLLLPRLVRSRIGGSLLIFCPC